MILHHYFENHLPFYRGSYSRVFMGVVFIQWFDRTGKWT